MAEKIAIVTGANTGIGYDTVKKLCERGVGTVYLTARNIDRGKAAVEKLQKNGLSPKFHKLDVTDERSVSEFADYIKKEHGGCDILINNAGMMDTDVYKLTYEDALQVVNVNYDGIKIMQKYFFPILKNNARVINISSDWGHITNLKNPDWIKRLTKEDVTMNDVEAFVKWFLDSVRDNTIKAEDFLELGATAYKVSKMAVCVLTKVQAREVNRGIAVNALHPGYFKTKLTHGSGSMDLEKSGDIPAYMALDVEQSVTGKFFWFDGTLRDWHVPDPTMELDMASYEEWKK